MIEHSRGGALAWLDRRAAERMLGTSLPAGARDLHYLRWQPSGDLAYYEGIIRFDCSKDDYLAFARARGMTLLSESGANVHLPASWEPAPDMRNPAWWQPTGETPPDAASGLVGSDGSLITKWESGHTYVMVTDTGHR